MATTDNHLGRILIVDDDAAVVWALESALGRAGYQVMAAAGAHAARRILARVLPDLLITDVRMPGISGLELLATLRLDHPELPVVVVTAYGNTNTAEEAMHIGAAEYLIKPLVLNRLLAVVARLVKGDMATIGET